MQKVILGIGLLLVMGCSSSEKEQFAIFDDENGTQVESYGIRYIFSDSARIRAQMTAAHSIEKSVTEEDKSVEVLYLFDSGVLIEFLRTGGVIESTIRADSAVYHKDKRFAELFGNAVMENAKGEKLMAEQLTWDEKEDQIFSDTPGEIQTAGISITFDSGFVSNSTFTDYDIKGIRGTVNNFGKK